MKFKPSLRALLAIAGSSLLSISFANAQSTLYWDNTAGGAINDGAGAWLGAGLWNNNGTPSATWTSGDNAIFGNFGTGGAVTLGVGGTAANSLTFNYNTTTGYTLGTAGNTLTLGSGGITKNAGSLAVNIAGPITLSANQTWMNNSATALTLNNAAGTNLGANTLIIDGAGNTIFTGAAGNVISGAGGSLTKNGTGFLELGGAGTAQAHTYSGTTTINGGVLQVYNIGTTGVPSGNLTINNGILQDYFGNGGSFTRGLGSGAGQVQILGGTSGFSGSGSTSTTFNVGGSGATLVWGSSFFNPTVFALQSSSFVNTNGKMSLTNGINLSGANRIIASLAATDGAFDSGATIAGVISNSTGTAGFTKTGVGNLRLTAANTYNGGTTINGGSITLSGNGTINSTNALNLGGGTLRLVNTAQVNRFADGAAITVSAGGSISYENTSGANLNYTETFGSVALNGGLLNVNLATNQNNATNNSQTLTFGGLTQSGTGTVAFSAAGTGPQGTGGDNMIVVTGAGTTAANEIIGSWATTGTTAALQTDYAVYNSNFVTAANISASAQSTWSTTTAVTSNYTSSGLTSATISGGTKNINSLRSTNSAASAAASNANITLTGHALAVGDVVTFSATTMPTGLTAGTPYYVISAVAGTSIQVSATSGGGVITPTGASTAMFANSGIQVSSGNNLGTTGILNGSATTLNILQVGGAGIITLPTTSAGNLYFNTGSGGITSAAPISNNTGALTLVKNGSGTLLLTGANNAYTGNTIVNAGTLQIGASQISTQINGGTYAGNIFIGAGATLSFSGNASNTLSGIISGDGNLNLNRGTTTLSGNNTYTGATSMSLIATNAIGSTINVSSFNSVVGGTASSSLGAPTTVANGTIGFGGGGTQQEARINFTGATETTDRILNFQFNGSGSRVIDTSGAVNSLLKFSTAPISNGTATGSITLQGSTNGEFTGGLAFAYTSLTKSGAGTWTLGGASGHTGATTISAGVLRITHGQALGTNAGSTTQSGTSALQIDGTDGAVFVAAEALSISGGGISDTGALRNIAGNNFYGGTVTLAAQSRINSDSGTLTLNNATAAVTGTNQNLVVGGAGNTTIAGLITIGSGFVSKDGAGTLVLSGNNSYTGTTGVSNGTLILSGNNTTTNTISASGATGATLTLSGNNSGMISNVTLSTSTGTSANSPRLNINSATGLGTGILLFGGGLATDVVRLDNTSLGLVTTSTANVFTVRRNFTFIGTQSLDMSSMSTTTLDGLTTGTPRLITVSANTLTLGATGEAVANLGVTKSGAGTLAFSGNNTFTGLTTVSGGALNIGSAGSLFSGNALTVGASGTSDFANAGQTLGAVINNNTATNALNFSNVSGTITLASLTGAGNTRFGSNGTVTGGIATGTVTSVGALNANISGGTVTAGGLLTGTISAGTVGAGSLSSSSVTGGINTITGAATITTLNGGATTVGGVATITTMTSGTANLNGATSAITTLNGGTVNLGTTSLTVSGGSTSGAITGAGGALTKDTGATLTLSGTNTYQGATNVTAGTLLINGSTSSTSLVTVGVNGTLGGSGTVGGNTTISGTHSPGNSPGIQTFGGNLSYVDGGTPDPTVNWELANNTTTVGTNPTANFDQIIVGGSLDFTNLTTINLSFNGAGSTVLWANTLWATDQSWLLYDVAVTTSNFTNLTLSAVNWLDSGGNLFNTANVGSFSLGQSGQDVVLNFTAIPEPDVAALIGALGGILLLRRRR